MPSIAAKYPNGEGALRAIQALMCELGADPPGYFDPFPRQPLQWAIVDPELPPMLRCLEWVRFHTMCYDGVPKNARGEPQRSPYCVGLDGKRLNRLDCARETGLSTSVVNRQFATLERLGYIQIKKDGSIWYRGKVEPRAEASVRQSVTECLQGPRKRSATPAQPVLRRLVTGRVIPASLLKATQSFPADDQAAVEAHILEVARWERQETARQIALVRQEAERRYQAAAWHGYHLEKDGRSWERAPAQESLFETPQPSTTESPDNCARVPEEAFASSSPISVTDNQIPVRDEMSREPAIPFSTGMKSFAGADGFHTAESAAGKPKVAAADASSRSGQSAMTVVDAAATKSTLSAAAATYAEHIRLVFAGTGKGVPTDAQISEALGYLPPQATPQGLAAFLRAKLSSIRHAGALVRLAQEYAHEVRYRPAAPVFQCAKCHDQGFVLPGGQFCDCHVGVRRRKVDERAQGAGS
jgi:hypothetical protein